MFCYPKLITCTVQFKLLVLVNYLKFKSIEPIGLSFLLNMLNCRHSKIALVFLRWSLFFRFASQWDLISSIAFFLLRLWNMFSPINESWAVMFIWLPNLNSYSLLIYLFISLYFIWSNKAFLDSNWFTCLWANWSSVLFASSMGNG